MKSDYIKNGSRVGCKGLDIDNNQIKDMYVNQGLTLQDIGTKLNISHWTVLSRLKKMGIRKTVRHSIKNPNVFNILTPESCYWAGFIAADGSIHISQNRIDIELCDEDEQHLKYICALVGRDDKIWYRDRILNGKIFKCSQVSLCNKNLIENLKSNFNIYSNKSNTLRPPQNIPPQYLNHFIRGYMDGDGSIGWHKHNNKPRLNICSGSKEFLEWLVDSIKNNTDTGNPSIREETDRSLYTIEFMGKQVHKILDWLYTGSAPETRLKRKYDKYQNCKTN